MPDVTSNRILEQSELVYHLSSGITVFERSTCGAILEKLKNESCVSRTCRECGGEGIVDKPFECPDPKDPEPDPEKRRKIRVELGAWCGKCHGTGVEPVRLSAEEQKLVNSGDWITTSDRDGQRSAVADETLVRYAHISRLLSRIPRSYRDIIEAAYGDEGEELSKGLKGRVWAVMPLTEPGKELLRGERDRPATIGYVEAERPVACLIALSELPRGQRKPDTIRLLAQALGEAMQLLRKAEALWNLEAGGLDSSEVTQ